MQNSGFSRIVYLAPPFLLGWFLVGSSGFDLLPDIGVFNGKRILQVITLAIILGLSLLIPNLRNETTRLLGMVPRQLVILLAVCLGIAITSSLRYDHPGYGLAETGLLVLLVISMFTVAASSRLISEYFDRLVLLVIAAIGIIAAITELVGLIVDWSTGHEFSFSKMLIRFAHPRFYNQLQTFCIPLLAALPFVFSRVRKIRLTSIILLGLQWALLLMSGGRGSVLAVTVALFATAFLFPATRKAWLGIHLAGLALGALLFLGVLSMHQSLAPAGGTFVEESVGRSMTHSSGRVQMWQLALDEARANPLLGSGPSRYACDSPPTTPSHPHSFPFRILAEWGIPAFLLIILAGGWLAWKLLLRSREHINRHHPPDVLSALLFSSITAAAMHACVSGLLIMPASQMMAVLVCGWSLGRLATPVPGGIPLEKYAIATLGAGLVLAVSISIFSVSELQKIEVRSKNLQKSGFLMPRYWHWGRSCQYFYPENSEAYPDKTSH